MDDQQREPEQAEVDDLEVTSHDAEQVKGGQGPELEEASFVRGASPQLGKGRGGIEQQHNETLVTI